MRNARSRFALAGVMALALSVTVGLGAGAEAAKKKKVKTTFNATKTLNQAIPDGPAAGPSTPLRSDITVGKKFKGKVVSDVNVTVQSTGAANNAADDLVFKLSAPNGRTIHVIENIGDQNIGPLTLDDDTRTSICDSATLTCSNPDATLIQPFVGRANLNDDDDDVRPLATFNGVRMKGNWTLTVYDEDNAGTNTLNSWSLQVKGVRAPRA